MLTLSMDPCPIFNNYFSIKVTHFSLASCEFHPFKTIFHIMREHGNTPTHIKSPRYCTSTPPNCKNKPLAVEKENGEIPLHSSHGTIANRLYKRDFLSFVKNVTVLFSIKVICKFRLFSFFTSFSVFAIERNSLLKVVIEKLHMTTCIVM